MYPGVEKVLGFELANDLVPSADDTSTIYPGVEKVLGFDLANDSVPSADDTSTMYPGVEKVLGFELANDSSPSADAPAIAKTHIPAIDSGVVLADFDSERKKLPG